LYLIIPSLLSIVKLKFYSVLTTLFLL
jgi:hypothetical protein